MTPEKLTRVQQAGEELAGTCLNLTDVVSDLERDDGAFMIELDNIVFECEGCGWWCRTDEELNNESGEMLCNDCAG